MLKKVLVVAVSYFGCAAPSGPDPGGSTGTPINAATGGVVTNGAVSLVIPPGSLAQDTVIDISPEANAPIADADGFVTSGAAFRFSPPGTQFDLAKPAILTMPYDPVALSAQGLDGRTLELAYFDEDLGRYNSIGGVLDPATGKITARVEHFTLYVAMAASLVPGDNPPTVALQSPVPNPIRSGAPVYLRATIRDYDIGGSVAGADLYVSTNGGAYAKLAMHPEATLDTFAALIPSASVGATLDYYVVATDSLGKSTQSGTVHVAVAHSYTAGSLNLAPTTQAIAAGFDRLFTAKGVDESATAFVLVPDSVSASNGLVASNAAGVNFSARTVGNGSVSSTVGGDTANAAVTVFNGALASVRILDQYSMPITGTLIMNEGARIQLDALGYDAYGNSILVAPTWHADSSAGYITSGGLLNTLDGFVGGNVTANIGDVTGHQAIAVNQRNFQQTGTVGSSTYAVYASAMTTRAGVPYIAYSSSDQIGAYARVAHFDGTSWVDDGSPSGTLLSGSVVGIAIGAGTSRLEVAWVQGATVKAAHLDTTGWVIDGNALNVDPVNDVGLNINDQISLAFDGDTPWVAFHEYASGALSVHVRHWNGSAWILDGGSVQDVGYNGETPSIVLSAGVPYVAFDEYPYGGGPSQLLVRRWDGSSWLAVGGSLNYLASQSAQSARLVLCGGKPTVAFNNYLNASALYLFASQYDGTTWQPMGGLDSIGAFNSPGNDYAIGSALACDHDIPYVFWFERNASSAWHRNLAHFNPTIGWIASSRWPMSSPVGFTSMTVAGNAEHIGAIDNYVLAILSLE